jgi:hypothetical protein
VYVVCCARNVGITYKVVVVVVEQSLLYDCNTAAGTVHNCIVLLY